MVSVCWNWKARGDGMTVQNTITKNIYIGNGSTTSFPFTFPCPKADYIKVFVRKNNLIAQTDNFTVDMDKATVTYPKSGTPLAAGENLVILRELPLEQPLNLVNQGPFFAEDIEATLDEEVMMIQQLREELSRSLTVPVDIDGETYFNTSIPIEAGKSFRVKNDGTGFEVTEDPANVLPVSKDILNQTIAAKNEAVKHGEIAVNSAISAAQSETEADAAMRETKRVLEQTTDTAKNVNVFIPSVDENGNISWTNRMGAKNPETQNIKGPQGVQGAAGIQGPKGDQGERGPQGIQGIAGPQGPQGVQGPKGNTGPQGEQGVKGDTGAVGPQGKQGAAGPQGAQGIQGPKGEKGDIGATGKQGAVGPQGAQGIQGSKGDKGEQGPQGISGIQVTTKGCYVFFVRDGKLICAYDDSNEAPSFKLRPDGHLVYEMEVEA